MGFSVASIHACCALQADSWITLTCVSRSGSKRMGLRNRVIGLYVNCRSERDGVRATGGRELDVPVSGIRGGGRRGGAVRVNASAKGRDGWSQISLDDVCRRLHLCFFEVRDLLLGNCRHCARNGSLSN